MAVTAKTLRLQRRLHLDLTKITDAQTRDLVKAWATAWDEIAPDLTTALAEALAAGGQVTRAQLLRTTRLRKALAVIADELDRLATGAGVRITGDLDEVIRAAGAAQASIIDSQLPPGSAHLVDLNAWSRVDKGQMQAIARRTTGHITALHYPLSTDAYSAVQRELLRGVASGSNPRSVARRMVARAEGGFNGGLNRALTISRTEMLDAHRAAAALSQAQHADVLQGWTWGASLSGRTCAACLGMAGSEHALTDPGPDGHQNCRCTRIPLVKPWSDLGIQGVQEPASVMPDAQAWFEGLPKAEQVNILGPDGHQAWSQGRFPMSAWATKRTTTGWRDSYVPAKPPVSSPGRRAA